MVGVIQIAGMDTYGQILKRLITDHGFKVTEFSKAVGVVRSRLNAAFLWEEPDEIQYELLKSIAEQLGFKDAGELDAALRKEAGLPPPLAVQLRSKAHCGIADAIQQEVNMEKFVDWFRSLPADKRRDLHAMLGALVKSSEPQNARKIS